MSGIQVFGEEAVCSKGFSLTVLYQKHVKRKGHFCMKLHKFDLSDP